MRKSWKLTRRQQKGNFLPNRHSLFRWSVWPLFIDVFLPAYLNSQGKFRITLLRKKRGFYGAIRPCMFRQPKSANRSSMIGDRNASSITRRLTTMAWLAISRNLCRGYGKFILSARAIHARQLCSQLSTYARSDSICRVIHSPPIRGISIMR